MLAHLFGLKTVRISKALIFIIYNTLSWSFFDNTANNKMQEMLGYGSLTCMAKMRPNKQMAEAELVVKDEPLITRGRKSWLEWSYKNLFRLSGGLRFLSLNEI